MAPPPGHVLLPARRGLPGRRGRPAARSQRTTSLRRSPGRSDREWPGQRIDGRAPSAGLGPGQRGREGCGRRHPGRANMASPGRVPRDRRRWRENFHGSARAACHPKTRPAAMKQQPTARSMTLPCPHRKPAQKWRFLGMRVQYLLEHNQSRRLSRPDVK